MRGFDIDNIKQRADIKVLDYIEHLEGRLQDLLETVSPYMKGNMPQMGEGECYTIEQGVQDLINDYRRLNGGWIRKTDVITLPKELAQGAADLLEAECGECPHCVAGGCISDQACDVMKTYNQINAITHAKEVHVQ